jgi:uncharacterized coiled-coil DUF342 family protein
MMRLRIDEKNISISRSMKRVRKTMIELDDSFDDTNRRFVRRIQESEVKEVLKRMKTGKALGPDDILIEI